MESVARVGGDFVCYFIYRNTATGGTLRLKVTFVLLPPRNPTSSTVWVKNCWG